ncbi:GNAT family N-acetyltransferase [Dactylosporangium aurantiacum]|uniref:GNAT family N-acetyltransferase n=1 Tax=Dactylosporangium aurantiacum TaxID=35754 RepID=A0A9Q9ISJ6_9ACTN|nr:GNAT family N-acetyltransferase [Dactylosporangium aurantiacum]MDG6108615.1 GNAT family N-acetyltransferase [Dactylosporangium aurantiacum]UWZ59165.1 GNAT family N-acetyltransferase [Dactylosporangium aurantiacum]
MVSLVRAVRAGDGAGRARVWQDAGRYFAALDPDTAREPDPEGLAAWHEELYERYAADPSVLMLVAEAGGEIVGTLVARLHAPVPTAAWQLQRDLGQRRVHVDALTVTASARRSGAGTALMAAAERWAIECAAAVITLETGVDNPTSMPFYEHRMGYTRHEIVFRKPLR